MSQPYATPIDTPPSRPPAALIRPPAASALLLAAGGAAMILMYALEIVFGLRYGRMMGPADLSLSWLTLAQALLFSGCLLLIAAGLMALGLALRQRAPWLATAGLVFAGLAGLAAAANTALVGAGRLPLGELGGASVLANLIAAALIGAAVLRRGALPRRFGWTLVAVGLATFPCILLTIPLEALMPPFVIADLPFVVWGLIFSALGLMLRRQARG